MRTVTALLLAVILVCVGAADAKSPTSPDGIYTYNEFVSQTLRASATETTTAVQTGTALTGFGGWKEAEVFVDVTAVSFTGGTSPTATLNVWLQRTADGGTTWDDVLALQAASISGGGTAKRLGAFNVFNPGTPAAPAAPQDAGGTPPFAFRYGTVSDSLRLKWQVSVTGAPTAQNVTFSVVIRGR